MIDRIELNDPVADSPVEPVYWQWRRKSTPWSTEYIFSSQAHATTPDSEVRALYTTPPAQPAPTGNAPCARHCEATAFQSEIRRLEFELRAAKPAPAVREPLSDAEITKIAASTYGFVSTDASFRTSFTRAVERAHGITGDSK